MRRSLGTAGSEARKKRVAQEGAIGLLRELKSKEEEEY